MSIAVAHSNTEEGRAALLRAADEAALVGTDLLVLHVVEGLHDAPDSQEVQAVHSSVGDTLRGGGAPEIEWDVRTAPGAHDTAGALLDLIVETGAEMLVVGSKRRSPLGKLLLGSTVQRVLLDSLVPVLVVKAHQN